MPPRRLRKLRGRPKITLRRIVWSWKSIRRRQCRLRRWCGFRRGSRSRGEPREHGLMDKPQSRLMALLIGLIAAAGVGVAAFALVTLLRPQDAADGQRAQAVVSSPASAPQ